MPLDPTKNATQIVISPIEELIDFAAEHHYDLGPVLKLLARAQSQEKFFRHIEDIGSDGHLFAIVGKIRQLMTTDQYYQLFVYLAENYGVEGGELVFEGTMLYFGDDYQNDLHLTANLVPRERPLPEVIVEEEPL